jgi:hypothetical protein
MAAIASHHIRLALFPLRLDTDRTGYVDIPHSLVRQKLLLTEDVNTIRATNNAIFNDIFWVHLAYVTAEDGIERLRALLQAERHYAPVLAGFETIDQGRRVVEDGTASAEARQTAARDRGVQHAEPLRGAGPGRSASRTGRGEGRLLSAQPTQDWLAERQRLAAHRHDGRAEVAVVPQGCERQHEHRARVLDARG